MGRHPRTVCHRSGIRHDDDRLICCTGAEYLVVDINVRLVKDECWREVQRIRGWIAASVPAALLR